MSRLELIEDPREGLCLVFRCKEELCLKPYLEDFFKEKTARCFLPWSCSAKQLHPYYYTPFIPMLSLEHLLAIATSPEQLILLFYAFALALGKALEVLFSPSSLVLNPGFIFLDLTSFSESGERPSFSGKEPIHDFWEKFSAKTGSLCEQARELEAAFRFLLFDFVSCPDNQEKNGSRLLHTLSSPRIALPFGLLSYSRENAAQLFLKLAEKSVGQLEQREDWNDDLEQSFLRSCYEGHEAVCLCGEKLLRYFALKKETAFRRKWKQKSQQLRELPSVFLRRRRLRKTPRKKDEKKRPNSRETAVFEHGSLCFPNAAGTIRAPKLHLTEAAFLPTSEFSLTPPKASSRLPEAENLRGSSPSCIGHCRQSVTPHTKLRRRNNKPCVFSHSGKLFHLDTITKRG